MNAWLITVKDFIASLTDKGHYVQVTDTKKLLSIKNCVEKTDLHFTSWLINKLWSWKWWRAKDVDIGNKKYFLLDYDIRSSVYDATWSILNKDDLFMIMKNIKDSFSWLYSNRKYIVFSGNWFHVYYLIDAKNYDPQDYRNGVRHIISQAPFGDMLDLSVSNIANLSRLPWFVNTKTMDKYWLPNELCEVVEINHNSTPLSIDSIIIEANLIIEKKRKKHEARLKRNVNKDFDDINSIPTYELMRYYKGIEIDKNKREFKDKYWMNRWMFYDSINNVIIDNWTHYLTGWLKWYNPYTFIKYEVLGGHATHKEIRSELIKSWFLSEKN